MPAPNYSDPSHSTIHHISQTLSASGIGCILWGEHLLRTYACNTPSAATDYKFIVEDHDLITAYHALRWSPDSIYTPCPGTYPCPVRYLEEKVQFDHETHRKGPGGRRPLPPHKHSSHIHPFPELHLHIHNSSNSNNPYPTVLALYRKSDFFPTPLAGGDMPDIKPGHMGRVTSLGRLIYAHEVGPRPTPARGGRFPDSIGGGVLIPSPMYLVEMLIGLGLRDCRIPGARSIWTRWLMYLREAYVEHGRGLDVWDEKALLPEVLRPVWRQASDSEISRLQEPIMGVWRDLAWALVGVDVERAKRTGHLAFQDWMVRQWDREETVRTMTMSTRSISMDTLVSMGGLGSVW